MATGGGSSRGVGVGCGLAVGVGGAAVAGTTADGVGEAAVDAIGARLVALHAARSNAAQLTVTIQRGHRGVSTLTIMVLNGAGTHPFSG
ncbi:MAG: hypothetical protein WEE03_03025 [Chloroflexota bacterium]